MNRYSVINLAALLVLLYTVPREASACRAPPPSSRALVAQAAVIVRATALEYVTTPPAGPLRSLNTPDNAEIEFRVEEVLKGEGVPQSLTLNGYLTDKDDYNDRPVPYDFVRHNGRGGSCGAYEYRESAEFLLFLQKRDNRYTVNWYALAPVNEQLRSADDLWLTWVREELAKSAGTKAVVERAAERLLDRDPGDSETAPVMVAQPNYRFNRTRHQLDFHPWQSALAG